MDSRTLARLEAKALVFKAIAHPTRLFMVEELAKGDKCVCELREMVGMDLSTISKHLSVLKNAGVVEDQKRGAQVFYRLRMGCILNFLGCVESAIKEQVRGQWELVK